MVKNKPELVAPAGDWPSLHAAAAAGADSVYFGVKGLNMRHMASNFDILEIKKVSGLLHEQGKKAYLALNTIILPQDSSKIKQILKECRKAEIDAVILWDMAVLSAARDMGLTVHLSTQASVANLDAVKMYAGLGVKRIVLARECTLEDIKQIVSGIKRKRISCQIEAFIHGAMCVSISGRCFMSLDSHGKSANRGQCVQPCRREFFIQDAEKESSFIIGKDYVLSPKDLCSMPFIDQLMDAGIHAFKIEGRIRSPEYIKEVTSVYRQAIDLRERKKLTKNKKNEFQGRLEAVYNRGFSTGFYFGQPRDARSVGLEHLYEKVFIGEITRFFKKIQVAELRVRTGEIRKNDRLIVIGKTTPAPMITVGEMRMNDKVIRKAGKGDIIGLKVPVVLKPKDKVFLWRKKS